MTRSIRLAALSLGAGSLIAFFSQGAAVAQFRPPQTVTQGDAAAAAKSPIGLAIAEVNGQMTVTGVAPSGPFAGALNVGDQITGVDGQAVTNVSDLLSRLVAAGSTGQATRASLEITRNGRPQAITVSNTSLGRITQAISQAGFPAAVAATGGNAGANTTTTGQTTNNTTATTGTTSAANVLQQSLGASNGTTGLSGTTILSGTTNPINATGTTNPIDSTGSRINANAINPAAATTPTPLPAIDELRGVPTTTTNTTEPTNPTQTTTGAGLNPASATTPTPFPPPNLTATPRAVRGTGTTSQTTPTVNANATDSTSTATAINSAGSTMNLPISEPTGTSAAVIGATGAAAANSATAQLNADLGVSLSLVNNGVVVTGVGTSGALANLGLQVGDQIVAINGQQVTSIPDALRDLLSAAQQGQNSLTQTATMTISRNGVNQTQNLPRSALTGLLRAQAQISAAISSMPVSAGIGTNAQLNGLTSGRPELPKATATGSSGASGAPAPNAIGTIGGNQTSSTVLPIGSDAVTTGPLSGAVTSRPELPKGAVTDNERPFEAAEQQQDLPTTVLTPQGPRIAMPGEHGGQQRGAAGTPGLPGAQGKGAAKENSAGKAGGAKAGGGARGGGGGAPAAAPGGS